MEPTHPAGSVLLPPTMSPTSSPPITEPAIPSKMVIMHPIGSRPGMMRRANPPTTAPKMIQPIIAVICRMLRSVSRTHSPEAPRASPVPQTTRSGEGIPDGSFSEWGGEAIVRQNKHQLRMPTQWLTGRKQASKIARPAVSACFCKSRQCMTMAVCPLTAIRDMGVDVAY